MPLTALDVLEPNGELASDLLDRWSDASVRTADVTAYLDEGYTRAADVADSETQDEAARQWTYRRAYRAKYQEQNKKASTIEVRGAGSVSRSVLITQIQNWRDLADQAEARYSAIPGVVPVVSEAAGAAGPFPPGSRVTTNLTAW